MKIKTALAATALLTTANLVSATPDPEQFHYTVTITNITQGISFTPFIAATHKPSLKFYQVGETASEEIIQIAEGGNITPMQDKLNASNKVFDVESSAGLLQPGESVSLQLNINPYMIHKARFSMASMLLPTNDTFVALNGVRLPKRHSITYFAKAYDAGSEMNSELCVDIPGPTCGGAPFSPEDEGEGYIYPSPTTHGEGDLSRTDYGWNGAVAKIVIQPSW